MANEKKYKFVINYKNGKKDYFYDFDEMITHVMLLYFFGLGENTVIENWEEIR